LGVGLLALASQWGCHGGGGDTPPPARIPGPDERRIPITEAPPKPLPAQVAPEVPPPPFDDVPLISQEAPEVPHFLDAYEKVGRPRIVVWVVHLPGDFYDEAWSREIDYAAIENILTDLFSARGRVTLISPQAARSALTPEQAKDLNSPHPNLTREVGDRLKADVLIFVRASATHQSGEGPAVRLVGDASNVQGGESLGQAVVDVPPPLDKPQMNKYARFVARKLMSDMTNSWTVAGPAPVVPPNSTVPPQFQPLPPAPVQPPPQFVPQPQPALVPPAPAAQPAPPPSTPETAPAPPPASAPSAPPDAPAPSVPSPPPGPATTSGSGPSQ
jgi:hypothetical protein